jgi:hypothetical protein
MDIQLGPDFGSCVRPVVGCCVEGGIGVRVEAIVGSILPQSGAVGVWVGDAEEGEQSDGEGELEDA